MSNTFNISPEDFFEVADEPSGPFSVDRVRAILCVAARAGKAMTYGEVLADLGYRFSRPKMRALCMVLDAIDRNGAARGEPELAVLVVRQGDGLPGQGWWIGRKDFVGEWDGPAATRHVKALQRRAFAFWKNYPQHDVKGD